MNFKIIHAPEAGLYSLTVGSSEAITEVKNTPLKVTGIAKRVKFFVTTFLSLSSLFLQAQTDSVLKISTLGELSIEELINIKVVTASKKEEPIELAPNVMYVINENEIKEYGYRKIEDLVARIPGFFSSWRPLEPMLQVRGIAPNENNKITFMINGHRINNVNETTNQIWPITLDNIERVEIIVGPGSVLYGSESLIATINLITKKTNQTEVISSYGTNNAITASVISGKEIDANKNITVSGTFTKSDGWKSADFYRHSGEKIANEGSDTRQRNLGVIRPSYFICMDAKLDNWFVQSISVNQAIPEYSQDRPELGVKATRYNYTNSLVIKNQKKFSDIFMTNLKISTDNKRLLRAIETNVVANNLDVSQILYNSDFDLNITKGKSYLQMGIQGQFANNRHNYTMNKYNPSDIDSIGDVQSILENKDTYVLGAYVSEEYTPFKKLKIVAAIRADRHSITHPEKFYFSPRIAVIFNPIRSIIIKAFVNKATKFPNPWESQLNQLWNKDNNPAATWANSPAYNPEQLLTYETQFIYSTKKIHIGINGYYQELKDFIGWSSSFTNIGDFKGLGCELDFKYHIDIKSTFWLNGSYQNAKFKELFEGDHGSIESNTGKMNSVPQLILNSGLSINLGRNITLSTSGRYFTRQVVKNYNIPEYLINGGKSEWDKYLATPEANYDWRTINNIFYLDASILWQKIGGKRFDLRFSSKNILNNKKRVGIQYANGDFQPEGRYLEVALFIRFKR
ncbi:MAG: TonB-dependent receptor [Bacteroidota bacterium]